MSPDPIQDALVAIKACAAQGTVNTADYVRLRSSSPSKLPSLQTLYRRHGNWPAVLQAAGVTGLSPSSALHSKLRMLEALSDCAEDLGSSHFSTADYERWREWHPDRPSSSVIRKWLGPWLSSLRQLEQYRASVTEVAPGYAAAVNGPRFRPSSLAELSAH